MHSAMPITAISTIRWSKGPMSPQYSGSAGSVPWIRPSRHSRQGASASGHLPASMGTSAHSTRDQPSMPAMAGSYTAPVSPSWSRALPGERQSISGAIISAASRATSAREERGLLA